MKFNHKGDTPEWRKSEIGVSNWLKNHGIPNRIVSRTRGSKWDILTRNGMRVEVKSSTRNKNGEWEFGIARQGRLNEKGVNFYVLAFLGLAKHTRLYVVLRAPLKKRKLLVTLRSLINKYAVNISDWKRIYRAEVRREKASGSRRPCHRKLSGSQNQEEGSGSPSIQTGKVGGD